MSNEQMTERLRCVAILRAMEEKAETEDDARLLCIAAEAIHDGPEDSLPAPAVRPAEPRPERVTRNTSTPEGAAFWKPSARAGEVETWPDWKRAGINTEPTRETQTHSADDDATRWRQLVALLGNSDVEVHEPQDVIDLLNGLVEQLRSATL